MTFTLNPIKKLIMIAFALHIISLSAVIIVTIFQIPLSSFYTTHPFGEPLFIMPPLISIVTIAVIFILHFAFTVCFRKILACEYNNLHRLKLISILSFVFILILNPILINLETRFISFIPYITSSLQVHEAQIILRHLMSISLTVRYYALSVLLIATSMAFYYYILAKPSKALESNK